MKQSAKFTLTLMAFTALLLSGCADLDVLRPKPDTTRFFFLRSNLQPEDTVQLDDEGPAIVVGPSSIAKFLDQPQIVTFNGRNQIRYSELNHWGEPIEESINRLLVGRISRDMQSSRVGFQKIMSQVDADYQVGYHIYMLGGEIGKSVQMNVSWWILFGDGSSRKIEGSVYEETIGGDASSYDAYVNAIEKMINSWADDICQTLMQLQKSS